MQLKPSTPAAPNLKVPTANSDVELESNAKGFGTEPAPAYEVVYSSHPTPNYRIGKYKFEKSQLKLTDPAEVEIFDKLLSTLPVGERRKIQKLDVAAAEDFLRKRQVTPAATKQTDSSTGERGSTEPKVGTGTLESTSGQIVES